MALGPVRPKLAVMRRQTLHRICFILPLLLSLAALGLVASAIALGRARPDGDEGAAAHIFQLLIVAQVPVMAAFALTSKHWRDMAGGLALHAAAIAAALAPVMIAGL
jgi:hypothetical protein